MKKINRFVAILSIALGIHSTSHAALLIEPVIGYSAGTFTTDISGATTDSTSDSIKGTSYGGRLGYQNFGLQLGLDYLASAMKISGDDLKTSEFGGFIGYEFPILFRVYAGYIFSGTGTLTSSDSTIGDVPLKGGTGPKVGIGFTLLPLLDFNIEYRNVKYSQSKDISTALSGVNLDPAYHAIMVGFSLPFTL